MESRLQSNEVRIPKTISTSSTSTINGHSSALSSILSKSMISSQLSNSSSVVPDFDFNSPCQYFKSSFARSLSMNTGSNQSKSLDFAINFGLPRTSSSSIREESVTSNNSTSLMCNVNGSNHHQNMNGGNIKNIINGDNDIENIDDVDDNTFPPPLPLTQPPILTSGTTTTTAITNPNANNNNNINNNGSINSSSNGHANPLFAATILSGPQNNISNINNGRNVWSTSHKQILHRRSLDSTEIEILRLRKECQNLIEENRRLMNLTSGIVGGNLVVPGNSPNIEAVILQTQVDTLQWQLKQVEASRQMYRAVMEEVIRFLERCHRNLDSMQQNEQIARSKSIHHVYHSTNNNNNNNTNHDIIITSESNNHNLNLNHNHHQQITTTSSSIATIPSPRARSSTNIMDTQHKTSSSICCSSNNLMIKSNDDQNHLNNHNHHNNTLNSSSCSSSSVPASYNNFRDFTWRRSPKRTSSAQLATCECDPEKLAQDAFRLLRTAQNLLNTQEPDLTQSKHIIEFQYSNSSQLSSLSFQQQQQQQQQQYQQHQQQQQQQQQQHFLHHQHQQQQQLLQTIKPMSSISKQKLSCNQNLESDPFCLTFSRKMNMRESRLSLRSSTDGSVHSTSSSKNETDEENQSSPPVICKNEMTTACSSSTSTTTEDESGFSSISSFQEVGLPINSTMISPIPSSINTSSTSGSDDSGELNTDINRVDSRNSTLKASISSTMSTTVINKMPLQQPTQIKSSKISNNNNINSNYNTNNNYSSNNNNNNNIGLPLNSIANQQNNHQRWDSAPAIPPRTATTTATSNIHHRFSTLQTDDTSTVLWV